MKASILLLLTMLSINDNLVLAFVLALGGVTEMPMARYGRVLFGAHDVSVKLPGGEVRTVAVEEGDSILEALEAHDIDAPHSCRTGLCTECAAMVTAKLENVKLDAAVLDPAVSAIGFVLTCSATVEGDGVELELGAGDKMYEAQYGEFRKGHEEAQVTKPGQWSLPLPDVGGA